MRPLDIEIAIIWDEAIDAQDVTAETAVRPQEKCSSLRNTIISHRPPRKCHGIDLIWAMELQDTTDGYEPCTTDLRTAFLALGTV